MQCEQNRTLPPHDSHFTYSDVGKVFLNLSFCVFLYRTGPSKTSINYYLLKTAIITAYKNHCHVLNKIRSCRN